MIKVLIDKEKKVLGYHGTDIELKIVDKIPERPDEKIGHNLVQYYNEKTEKVEWRYEKRELTESERISQSINDINLTLADLIAGEGVNADDETI